MELTKAREIADRIVVLLKPYCARVEIAGSIRRRKADVHDIEIVCLPKDELIFDFNVPGLFDCCDFVKNGPRYKQILTALQDALIDKQITTNEEERELLDKLTGDIS